MDNTKPVSGMIALVFAFAPTGYGIVEVMLPKEIRAIAPIEEMRTIVYDLESKDLPEPLPPLVNGNLPVGVSSIAGSK